MKAKNSETFEIIKVITALINNYPYGAFQREWMLRMLKNEFPCKNPTQLDNIFGQTMRAMIKEGTIERLENDKYGIIQKLPTCCPTCGKPF